MWDTILSLRILPVTPVAASRSRHTADAPAVKHVRAYRRLVLTCAQLQKSLSKLSKRLAAVEAATGGSGAKRRLRKTLLRAGTEPLHILPEDCPLTQPEPIEFEVWGLAGVRKIVAFDGICVADLKVFLQNRGWTLRKVVFRFMLRISDSTRIYDGDKLVLRPAAPLPYSPLRAGAPKGHWPWETSAVTRGVSLVTKITVGDKELGILSTDSLHQSSEGIVLVLLNTWMRFVEARTSEQIIWIMPGRCASALLKAGIPNEHITVREILVLPPSSESPERKIATIVFRGEGKLQYDVGMEIIKVPMAHSRELLVEFDPRWSTEDTLAKVKQDWRQQAPALLSAALQKTVVQGDLFGYRSPTLTSQCWQTRIYMSEEDALKLLVSSGQKSVFVRPALPEDAAWKQLWTIVWSHLPDVAEANLLQVLLGHAARLPGHVGLARAYRNLGLRVPWDAVARTRQALRPKDLALNETNLALKDEKSFSVSGIPRGATPAEIMEACKQIGWKAIPQTRLPGRMDKEDVWWITAETNPDKTQFLWNEHHVLISETTSAAVKKSRRPDPKRKPVEAREKPDTKKPSVDPLLSADPWKGAVAPKATSWPASSSTSAPSSGPQLPTPVLATSTTVMDPRVAELAQRVGKLEDGAQELHQKVDGLDSKIDNVGTSMSQQFSEVLKILGGLQDKKRSQPDH